MGEGEFTVKMTYQQAVPARANMLGANPQRVGLLFSGPGTLNTTLVFAVGWPTVAAEYPIPATGYLSFYYKDVGPLVAGAWDIQNPMGGGDVWATEILLLPR